MFPIANVPEAITVAASNASDSRTTWTNYGACIDLFAPGSSIRSATFDNDASSGTKSGTSMASPHVAGAAALVLSQAPAATPAEVRDVLVAQATQNIVTPTQLNNFHTMNSHLLYSRAVAPRSLTNRSLASTQPCTAPRRKSGSC